MDNLDQWLENSAGLKGKKLEIAREKCKADVIENLDELYQLLENGDLQELFSNSFIYSTVKAALTKKFGIVGLAVHKSLKVELSPLLLATPARSRLDVVPIVAAPSGPPFPSIQGGFNNDSEQVRPAQAIAASKVAASKKSARNKIVPTAPVDNEAEDKFDSFLGIPRDSRNVVEQGASPKTMPRSISPRARARKLAPGLNPVPEANPVNSEEDTEVLEKSWKSGISLRNTSYRRKTKIKAAEEEHVVVEETRELTGLEKLYAKHFPPPVIMPDSPERLSWDVYMMILILYYAVAVPVRVGFDIDPPYESVENFFTCCFAFDMILNFNTALKVKTEIFTNRWIIAKDYFKCWFWIDLIASFPFELVMPTADEVDASLNTANFTAGPGGAGSTAGVNKLGRLGKIFRLLRIFKLLRLLKLGRIMKRMKSLTDGNPNVVTLVKTFTAMAAILHWTACAYWYVVQAEGEEVREELELMDSNFWHPPDYIADPDADFNLQYAYSFFWGISVTMGAGWDIQPGTKVEVAFSSIMITVGALLYITLLGSVTTIVANISAEKTKQVQQLDVVLSFLKRRMVSKSVFKKVRDYYEFMWEDPGAISSEPQRQLDRLPISLQITLASEIHKNLLSQIPVFNSLTPDAAFTLVKCWKRVIYVPEDVIVKHIGEDHRLYILIRGKVRLYVHTREYMQRKASLTSGTDIRPFFLQELARGSFFGENAVLGERISMGMASEERQSAVAVTYSELLYISRKEFQKLVTEHELEDTVRLIRKAYRSRKAKMRWRLAIVLVRVVVRLNRMSKLPMLYGKRKKSSLAVLAGSFIDFGSFMKRGNATPTASETAHSSAFTEES